MAELGAHVHLASGGRCLDRIQDHVDQGLLQLRRIAVDADGLRGGPALQRHAALAREHALHTPRDRLEVGVQIPLDLHHEGARELDGLVITRRAWPWTPRES